MWNSFSYNVAICPYRLGDPYKRGCTIPGSPNGQADTALNQAGIWMTGAQNDLLGNRMANSFNGMLVDVGHFPRGGGASHGKSCVSGERIGRWEGNTFHGHGRFGTYGLGSFFPKSDVAAVQTVETDGRMNDVEMSSVCNAVALAGGGDNGQSHAIKNNFGEARRASRGWQGLPVLV